MHAYDQIGNRTSASKNFVYDGWAMIQETSGAEKNSYVYGVDLSGTLQGAGTIGGLLSANLSGTNRFSTKYSDGETRLVYYGRRYYSPTLSRWMSMDSIGEKGGANLYGFVGNAPIHRHDILGRIYGVVLKIIEADLLSPGMGHKYGHQWVETDSSSYGWYPVNDPSFWEAIFGTDGEIKSPDREYEGKVSDITWETEKATSSWFIFSKVLEAGKSIGKKCNCADKGDVLDCINAFAGEYSGKWALWRSCRTFSEAALSACCLKTGQKTVNEY